MEKSVKQKRQEKFANKEMKKPPTNQEPEFRPGMNPNLFYAKQHKNKPKIRDISINSQPKQVTYAEPMYQELTRAPVNMSIRDNDAGHFSIVQQRISDASDAVFEPISNVMKCQGSIAEVANSTHSLAKAAIYVCAASQIYNTLTEYDKLKMQELSPLLKCKITLPEKMIFFLHTLGEFDTDHGHIRLTNGLVTVVQLLIKAIQCLHYNAALQQEIAPWLVINPVMGVWNPAVQSEQYIVDHHLFHEYYQQVAKRIFLATSPPTYVHGGSTFKVPPIETINPHSPLFTQICNVLGPIHTGQILVHHGDNQLVNLGHCQFNTDLFNVTIQQIVISCANICNRYECLYGKLFKDRIAVKTFIPTAHGNACQLVKRTHLMKISVPIPLSQLDLKVGYTFDLCNEVTINHDISGFVPEDARQVKVRLVFSDFK